MQNTCGRYNRKGGDNMMCKYRVVCERTGEEAYFQTWFEAFSYMVDTTLETNYRFHLELEEYEDEYMREWVPIDDNGAMMYEYMCGCR